MRFFSNKEGNVQLILSAVVAGVVLAISIAIIFSVLGGIDYSTIDNQINGSGTLENYTPALNASQSLIANVNTFYTISPIYLVVLAAVGIISAVMMIMVKRE